MNVWTYLERRAIRRDKMRMYRIAHPKQRRQIDARGWIGIGVYSLSIVDILTLALVPEIRKDDFFKTLSTLIIGTGFINGMVSWAYSATKSGGELADRNAALVERQAATDQEAPTGKPGDPVNVKEAKR